MHTIIATALIFFAMLGVKEASALDAAAKQWIETTRNPIAEKEVYIAYMEAWRDDACGRISGEEARQCKLVFEHVIARRKYEIQEIKRLIVLKELSLDHELHVLLHDKGYSELNVASNQIDAQVRRFFRAANPAAVEQKAKQNAR